MDCTFASFDEDLGRYKCSVSGDECVYFIPNSKSCAKDYGEGPDVTNLKNESEEK
ncbi:MAG: hypothetical protein K0R54_4400 [Clostridiaceae bacterium]|jgi:hypothetical protein|nr:hypothetical protein [Clostridiaceae bacterium]